MTTQEILQAAQGAKMPLALADADTKNAALEAMAVALIVASDKILEANQRDLDAARGRVSDVMLDRLALTPSRLTDMAKGMRDAQPQIRNRTVNDAELEIDARALHGRRLRHSHRLHDIRKRIAVAIDRILAALVEVVTVAAAVVIPLPVIDALLQPTER